MDQIADLATNGLLPIGQGIDVFVNPWVGGVFRGRSSLSTANDVKGIRSWTSARS